MQNDVNTTLATAGIDFRDVDLGRVGEWQYLRTDDKPNKKNGHVKIHSASPLRLTFMNMRTEVQGMYVEQSPLLSFKQSFRTLIRSAPRRPDTERYYEASKVAKHNWQQAQPASAEHPYLVAKQIKPHGIRQLGTSLVLPLYGVDGRLWSTQHIGEDGAKYFQKGGKKRGCYYPIGGKPEDFLFLVEGFATGATIHEALGAPVAVCFDAGNLVHVAREFALRFPDSQLVFCADNDAGTEDNPGVSKAIEASQATGGCVLYPRFPLEQNQLTDWNDMHTQFGLDQVRDTLMGLL